MMRLRTQLVIAFLLLAIVPLTAIVGYSYSSSIEAVREAVREEGEQLTAEMDERLVQIRRELQERVAGLADFPFLSLSEARGLEEGDDLLLARLVGSMGDAAPLVRRFEFYPAPEAGGETPPPPPGQGAEPPAAPPAPAAVPRPPGAAPPAPGPLIIHMEEILRRVESQIEASTGEELTAEELEEFERGMRVSASVAETFSDPDFLAALIRGEVDEEEMQRRLERVAEGEVDSPLEAEAASGTGPEGDVAGAGPVGAAAGAGAVPAGVAPVWEGSRIQLPVFEGGARVGQLEAEIEGDELLARVLADTSAGEDEIAFAVDPEGRVYAADPSEARLVERLLAQRPRAATGAEQIEDHILVTSEDEETGLIFGIARPIRSSVEAMRRAAGRNLASGLGLTLLAMLVIVPLTRRLTSRLEILTRGADRIAEGDLTARVPVSGPQEVERLAESFNRMAAELSHQREALLGEEERRRRQQLREQRLELEYRRKKDELEEARRFQLSLLPSRMPSHPGLDLAVHTETATEVGGDYYDFHVDGQALTVAIGDATGHGARAGTMVTVVKSLFAANERPDELAGFLSRASATLRRMELERMQMTFTLARFEGPKLTVACGGMPPVLVRRVGGGLEEIDLPGMPLGGLPYPYEERSLELAPGDLVLLMSDGLAELADAVGEPFGYERVKRVLGESRASDPRRLLDDLIGAAHAWAGTGPPPDDVTLLVVQRTVGPGGA